MLTRLFRFAERLPSWLRPSFYGGIFLFIVVALRMILALPEISSQGKLLEAGLGLLGATAAGAAGGLGYTLLGSPARRIPYAGAYLAGLITVGAYMLALYAAAPVIAGEPMVQDKTDAIVMLCVTGFFGLFIGHIWFRD